MALLIILPILASCTLAGSFLLYLHFFEFDIPHMAGGRSYSSSSSNLGSIGHWRFDSTLARLVLA